MRYSTIKEVKTFCQSLDSQPDWREVVTMLAPCFVSGEAELSVCGVIYHVFDNH